MAAEFHIEFKDSSWVTEQKQELIEKIEALPTHVKTDGEECWLLGLEARESEDRRRFDVRIFIKEESPVLMEISAHPSSIEHDLKLLFSWLSSKTQVSIVDEDGELSGW